MIVAVEGVSAAGKTTWCRRHAPLSTVAEYAGPDPTAEGVDAAEFWTRVNQSRWAQALAIERMTGNAFCDTDPLKLHYTWCLWQRGRASREQWLLEVQHRRTAIVQRALGFADRIVMLEPDEQTVRTQRDADQSRRRGNFEFNLSLAPLLGFWYRSLEQLSYGRVVWNAAASDVLDHPSARDRYSVALFDDLIACVSSHQPEEPVR